MPTFDTPEPISVTINKFVGDARVIAGDSAETTVEVSPSDPADEADVKAARHTRVEYADGALLISDSKSWRHYSPFGGSGSIALTIALPAGSALAGEALMGDLRAEGRLGACRFRTATGHIWLDEAGPLRLGTGTGRVTVGRAVGAAEITGCGELHIRTLDGSAVIKNLNGPTWVGEITGELRCRAANGDIVVERALAGIDARTANGDIRVGEVVRGSVSLHTASGELEIGIRAGTAALLDVRSHFGQVRNALDAVDGPGAVDETVEVHARTAHGDIVIRRAAPVDEEIR